MPLFPLPGLSRQTKAFTLTELLIVIGIIAVLAVILLPVMSMVTNRARATTCQSNLRQIYGGFAGYAADNGGILPVIDDWRMGSSTTPQRWYVWFTAIEPYVGTADAKKKTVLVCPVIDKALSAPIPVTYTLNRGVGDGNPDNAQINGTRTNHLTQATRKVLMFDSGQEWTSISYTEVRSKYGSDPKYTTFSQVHAAKANVLFCDGHVETCDFKKDLDDSKFWTLN